MKTLCSAVAALVFSLASIGAATVDFDRIATPTAVAATSTDVLDA